MPGINFTSSQWEFLSIMAAFEAPISLDVIAQLSPLPLGLLIELIRKCESHGWVYQDADGGFGLSNNLPGDVKQKLKQMNSPEKLAKIVRRIKSKGLIDKIPRQAFQDLLQKSEGGNLTIKDEMALAIEALKEGKRSVAEQHMQKIDRLLPSVDESTSDKAWFISEGIRLAEYCRARYFSSQTNSLILVKIISMSQEMGDERNWAIANLLLGRVYWLQNKLDEALLNLKKGKEKAEELGDHDILSHASLYIGLYYFIQGYLNKAANYLEPATQDIWESEEYLLGCEAQNLISYCYINRCDFQRAISTLDFFRQLTLKHKDHYTSSYYRALLGINLWVAGKREEAVFHLEGAMADSLTVDNVAAYWVSHMGLCCLHFSEGAIDQGLPLFEKTLRLANDAGIAQESYHPAYLESYFNAELAGAELPAEWRFDALFEKVMIGPNIDLQGTALRLRAVKSIAAGKDEASILKDLQDSESLLERCEDSFQLVKTRIEIVRYYLRNNQYEKAAGLAYNIYRQLTGYSEIFFPDDLRFLLEQTKIDSATPVTLEPTIRILEELFSRPETIRMDLLLSTLSGFFRAERSGVFVFSSGKGELPELQMARNLSRSIISDHNFRRNMDMIKTCYQNKKPILANLQKETLGLKEKKYVSVICMPLLRERVQAVLYFDNSYIPNCFDFVDLPILESLGHHLSSILERKESDILDSAEPLYTSVNTGSVVHDSLDLPGIDILVKDKKMVKTFNQATHLAESDAPVLILGETGVGKEVVAKWIHLHSARRDKPFVVVDLTTIPDNLIDSELFGHEKGAFTGAHQQKIGRVEMAEGGTLFFDEIGEIPSHLQVKLLRLMEQKTFMRVGGTKTKTADFRLVAATNRNLLNEVKKGRFREDLYYRLNTLELTIPPLRERVEDISAIASHFMTQYAKKYNKTMFPLNKDQTFILENYEWPGNVRELKSVIERAVLLSENGYLVLNFPDSKEKLRENSSSEIPTLEEIQRQHIKYVLNLTNGKIGNAAKILGIKRTSLYTKLKRLGMS